MEHSSCTAAVHLARRSCDSLETAQERRTCRTAMNLHADKKDVVGCETAIQCNVSGYSAPVFTCCPGSTVTQQVHGVPIMAKASSLGE